MHEDLIMDDIRIDPEEARNLKDAVYIDARNPQAWGDATTKLPGALRVPANALGSNFEKLPKDKTLVPYCT